MTMKTIELTKEKIYCGNLLLVNKNYPFVHHEIKNLISADMRYPSILMKQSAAHSLQLILDKIQANNDIVPVSGYRTENDQTVIYETSLKDNGEVFTKKYVALPNHSEHQTGLAIDLGLNQKIIDFICPVFPYHGICNIFRKAAPNYGFIERYTKEKENTTGISHEPWHFRYVGFPHSKIITENALSLEEYIKFIKNYKSNNKLVYRDITGKKFQIYYIPANNNKTSISLLENNLYQISGNNIDGFIVTVREC